MLASEIIKRAWPNLEIGRLLGSGSFGNVYEVFSNGRALAVKLSSVPREEGVVPDDLRPEEVDSFFVSLKTEYENEIRMMQKLSDHPNVVQVKDYCIFPQEEGVGFHILYQMELLTPLGSVFADHAPTPLETRKLGIDICRALEACEALKMVHRDVKPDNIFVDANGSYKLGDFGTAKSMDNLTALYSRHGTANYMAPEVAAANRYDGRADIYSLGLVLYRQLNDFRLPFLGRNRLLSTSERSEALMMRLRGDEMPAPAHAGAGFSEVILKACAFKPEDRFRNAAELRKALEALTEEDLETGGAEVSTEEKVKESSEPAKRPGRILLIILASALLLVWVLFFVISLIRKEHHSSSGSEAMESPESEFDESLYCRVHSFGEWKLLPRESEDQAIGVAVRTCTVCGFSECQRHEHEFSDWIVINEGLRMKYCSVCREVRFDGACTHSECFVSGPPLDFSRFDAKLNYWGKLTMADLSQSFFCGTEICCEVCGFSAAIPHVFGEPVYAEQDDGTTQVRVQCLICGFEPAGDSFVIEADGTYRSHLHHDVADNMYSLNGLDAEEAEKYHIVIECSCGQKNFLEEHVFVDGKCLCGKKG